MIHPMTFTFQSRIGLGTWQMGEAARSESDEVKAIEAAIQMGYRLIDTAEMYASGNAESLIGKALKIAGHSKRDQLQIVSKVLPSNASTKGTVAACEASIKRMGCDYIDCYLLHWQGSHSYEATIEGFLKLYERGLIRSYGISNFDTLDLQKWIATENRIGAHERAVCNQVYYALNVREIVAIPKTVNVERLEENLVASHIQLDLKTLESLDAIFLPPTQKSPLMVI